MWGSISNIIGAPDPRMAVYPLMDSPLITVILSALYFSFIKVIGPAWMKNRKPYDMRTVMVIYNGLLVALSSWIFLNGGLNGWFTTYSWRCEPIDRSSSPVALKMVFVCWVFYVSKILEFADTIFFVLRKKDGQLNFLHVFHHTTVPVTAWYGVSYGPGGYNTIFPMLNSFVHIWMYLYYGLSALGPSVQKYLWWKKYLTSLQLIQFTIVFIYYCQALLFPTKECKLDTFLIFISVIPAIIFFILFINFYISAYKKKPRNKYHAVSRTANYNGIDRKGSEKKN